ncbi:MAG TPA: ribonuclease M5 [Bacillota bacterium]|nr:ribonuclease M5 [Bacillota bacterium]
MKKKISEIIIVEGRHDTDAINRAVDGYTIETHGFGIKKETWDLIKKAYETRGIIILTDPDHAGMQIRRRIKACFPQAKEAHIKDSEVEDASPEAIVSALSSARCGREENEEVFTFSDLIRNGLSGNQNAVSKRRDLGDKLGIGYGSTKQFLKKLNLFGIRKEDFHEALQYRKNS